MTSKLVFPDLMQWDCVKQNWRNLPPIGIGGRNESLENDLPEDNEL